jgi:hypothetical protein
VELSCTKQGRSWLIGLMSMHATTSMTSLLPSSMSLNTLTLTTSLAVAPEPLDRFAVNHRNSTIDLHAAPARALHDPYCSFQHNIYIDL